VWADTQSQEQARLVETAAESVDGVQWAAHNGILGRVIVRFDPTRTTLACIVEAVERVDERPERPIRHRSARLDPMLANKLALGADLLGGAAAFVGRAVRLPRLPAELAVVPVAVDVLPWLGKGLRSMLGRSGADVATAVASSGVTALTQTGLGSVSDAVLRGILIAEETAHRTVWRNRAKDLHPDAASGRATSLATEDRPAALAEGPIEAYARRSGLITLLAAGGLLAAPGGRRRAAQALAIGWARPARVGREAYIGRLGRLLANRGVVARDPSALRRLDRIATVVVDADALFTGRIVISDVLPISGTADQVRERAADLLEGVRARGGRTDRRVTRGDWALAPDSRTDPVCAQELKARGQTPRAQALALTRGGELVAIVQVEAELDPLATALVAASRRAGRVLIAGASPSVAEQVRADGTVPGGARLAASIRQLQHEGGGVALVAATNDVALAAADCGVGIMTGDGRRPPWGAHLLAGPGLEETWLIVEAVCVAKRVSQRSARFSLIGSVAGAVLALMEQTPQSGRRAITTSTAAGIAALISGVWSARSLGRRSVPVPEDLMPWHALPIGEVLRLLDASPDGLTQTQARNRQAAARAKVDGEGNRAFLTAVASELDTPLTAPLAAGAGISAATGSTTDALLVFSVIMGSALLSAREELAAARALRRLQTVSAVRVRLVRDGVQGLASAEELVTGDVVSLEAGDAVPADCRLLTSSRLEVDESTLTGESAPVAKDPAATLAATVGDRTSMVYAGTTVTVGTATAIVVATGQTTVAGRSTRMALDDAPVSGVAARLTALTNASAPLAAGAAATVLLGGLARGRVGESVNSAVALAIAAIPEGLPFVATAAELSASKRLARKGVLVRNQRSIEAAGRVDVVCFDKTGTLTEGRIQLRAVSTGRSHSSVARAGPQHRGIVAAAVRASPVSNGHGTFAHPTDEAVVRGATDMGVGAQDGAPDWASIRELPFEPERGFHAVLGQTRSGQLISVKGAPEIVLPRCAAWSDDGRIRSLSDVDRRQIDAEVDRLAHEGLRVLAVAERPASRRRHFDDDRVEGLRLCGLIGLADTVRSTAAEAVQRLRRAGVKVIMVTGDHPSTAEAIGTELGLLDGGTVVTGAQLDEYHESTVDALVAKASIFARVSPTQKMTVVRSLRRLGHVVAVTGDGANDAPAIRLADVGIALGGHGTDAARQSADMIVIDNSIETIADGLIAGRAMWASVRDAVALLVGGNLGEILFTVFSSLVGPTPALNARQILFVNLMTDLLPALVLATRAPNRVGLDALAKEGPETSLGDALTHDLAKRAIATSLGTATGWLAARSTGTAARASTVAVASLVASQLAQTALAAHGDPAVLAAVGLSAAAMVATVQTPGLSHFFASRPLGPVGWGIVLGATAVAAAAGLMPRERVPRLAQAIERILCRRDANTDGDAARRQGPDATPDAGVDEGDDQMPSPNP
jgi:cation-transporting ATPase I